MQLTFLVENNSLVGSRLVSESALSILMEDGPVSVLFDAGCSDVFLANADHMNKDLSRLDWAVLSHGHYDHTWGLKSLIEDYFELQDSGTPSPRPKLLAHPKAFVPKQSRDGDNIGMNLTEEALSRHFDVQKSSESVWITENLVFLGEIERIFDFEPPTPLGVRLESGGLVDDYLPDDTALAHVSDRGVTIIAGCAHAGICNTVEQAKRITGVDKVHTVLGGFHLQKAKPERLDPTVEYLAALDLDALYACHCTDLVAKVALARSCPVKEVGSGLSITL